LDVLASCFIKKFKLAIKYAGNCNERQGGGKI
jgi:hypothetical protein